MKKIILALSISLLSLSSFAAENCNDTRRIYKVCSDQSIPHQAILKRALEEEKLVLIKFGADWCSWCHSLHTLFNTQTFWESLNNQVLLSEIGVYMYDSATKVESGRDILQELLSVNQKDSSIVTGFPFLVVVNPQDNKSVFIGTGDLEDNSNGNGHSPDAVRAAILNAVNQLKSSRL